MIGTLVAGLSVSCFAELHSMDPSTKMMINHKDGVFTFGEKEWWHPHFSARMKELKAAGGAKIVFFGDSITHDWTSKKGKAAWEKYFATEPGRAFNFGLSGSHTENALWFVENGALDGYEAKAVVVMIGTNNTGHHKIEEESPVDTLLGIRGVIEAIHRKQPKARIVLMPILTRGDKPGKLRERNEKINAWLPQFADGKSVIYFDMNDLFLNADGTIKEGLTTDTCHLSPQGFELWGKTMKPLIDKILAAKEDDLIAGRYPEYAIDTRYSHETDFRKIGSGGWWFATIDKRDWVLQRLYEKRRQVSESKTKEFDIVMMGDSITHRWEWGGKKVYEGQLCSKYSVLNLGHNGQGVRGALWYAQNMMGGYKAKVVTVMIGTNNGGGPEGPIGEIPVLLAEIQKAQPEATIVLMPIFPRGVRPGHPHAASMANRHEVNLKVNEKIKDLADGKKVIWLDFNEKFLNSEGKVTPEIMDDYLHPTEKGYQIWLDAMMPTLEKIIGR